MGKPLHPAQNTDWLKTLAPDSCINSKEFAKLLGYKTFNSLSTAIERGQIPPPDFISHKLGDGFPGGRLSMWRASTVRAELKRREAETKKLAGHEAERALNL